MHHLTPRSNVLLAARRAAAATAVTLAFPGIVHAVAPAGAHGGTFLGPADVVPPLGPTTGTAPDAPRSGGLQPPPSTNTTPPAPTGPTLGPGPLEPDLSVWQLWWGYNRAAFLDLRAALHSSDVLLGSDAFFLGREPQEHARDKLVPARSEIRGRIVPALFVVLETERDADMVTGALIALAKIGEDDPHKTTVRDRIVSFLADSNQEIAETAAVSLGILAAPGATEVLTTLLADTEDGRELVERGEVPWRTRAFAAYGLGLIGHRSGDDDLRARIVATLIAELEVQLADRTTPDVAVACVSALGLVPLPIAPADVLGPGAQHAMSGRRAEIRWLCELEERDGLPDVVAAHVPTAITRLVADTPRSWGLKEFVAWRWLARLQPLGARGARGDRNERDEIGRALEQSLVLGLGRLGDADEDPVDASIRSTLMCVSGSSRNVEVRRFALIGLGEVAARPGEGAAPGTGSAPIRTHLLEQLESGRSDERPWVALALGVLGRHVLDAGRETDPEVDRQLLRVLASARSPREVGAFAIACGMRRLPDVESVLVERLADVQDDETRGFVALALGMSGAVGALEPIQAVVRRSKYRPELLRQAAISLGLLGDKHVADVLIDMLENARSLSAQASIAFGLGSIGDARSIEPLIEMLGNREITPRARAFAAVALGIVADKEAQPWNAKLSIGINYRANTMTLTDGRGAGILEIL